MLPLLSHYLLPADYGIVSNFGVLTGIVGLLITCSIDGSISVNYYNFTLDNLKIYIYNCFLVSFCIFLLVFLFVVIFNNQLYKLLFVTFEYQLLCVFMSFFNLFTIINLVLWRLEEKPLAFGIYDLTNTIINITLSLIFVILLKQSWIGRVNAIVISTVVYGAFSCLFLYKRGYLKAIYNRRYFKDILFFGVPLIPHALSFWVRSGIDRVFISEIWGTSAVGLYATGFQFGILVSFLVLAFNNAFVPYLYKTLSNKNEEELAIQKEKMVKLTYLIMLGLLICGTVFVFFSNFILNLFFAKTYIEAADFILWAIISQIFQSFYLLFVNYIFFSKQTKKLALITISCALLQLPLSYFMIKGIGPIGAAYSATIIAFVNFVIVLYYSNKVYPMPWTKVLLSFSLSGSR